MLKHCVRTLVVTILLSFSTALGFAQSTDIPKFEVGAQFSFIRLRDIPFPGAQGQGESDPGYGMRVGYNLTNSIAAEVEFNYFGKDLTIPTLAGNSLNTTYSTSRTQGFAGVKYMALRGDKFGIGGKLRPGFARFIGSGAGSVIQSDATVLGQFAGGYTTFAMDIGGVFEYYPSRKLVARVDLGDTIIRIKGIVPGVANGFTSNNLQLNVGFGFRF